ncbi:flagellar filament capping protein FliD [Erythrobacter sp. 3-20A1M]|uniref:flagellar filament capping protein FliD n=1 Tax=Erythrobacter sp. 3-20A1M TaxID=2653850 RepID=UPI001BFC2576|nr:flagellar filament capping protein FliD [Erythrobacter sp. 3-20A1M]QWC57407.1 flagellar filament capping protein FliD [Erythrobacter sp. 3-20A1M]
MDNPSSSILSALGGGSGIDMAKLATDLSTAKYAAQIEQLKSRSDLMETRISAAAALKGQLSQLASALGERVRTGDLAASAATANPAVAKVSVAGGARASGTYSLEVTQLASSQTLVGKPYATSDSLVGEGTLTFDFGTVSGGSFSADGGTAPLSIEVTADDTLSTLASKISTSGSGLTAYVVSGSSGAQLVIKGEQGAVNGFTISGSGASVGGGASAPGNIDFLDWSPATDGGQLKATAKDARLVFDGVEVTSATNTVTGLPAGLSLTLTGTNAGAPTEISFDRKDGAITSLMEDLVAALNDVTGQLKQTASPLGGELGNDSGARALKRELAALAGTVIMPNAPAGAPRTLGDLGLTASREGTFRLDADRLKETLARDPDGAAGMFTSGLYGVFATMDKLARNLGSTTDPGSLGGSIARYERQQTQIENRLEKIAEQQENLRAQLGRSFSWADRRVTQSQSTLSFLKSQVALWTAKD